MFVNTGQEFDGSDAGARPDEAISWGKIKSTATPVKVCVCVYACVRASIGGCIVFTHAHIAGLRRCHSGVPFACC